MCYRDAAVGACRGLICLQDASMWKSREHVRERDTLRQIVLQRSRVPRHMTDFPAVPCVLPNQHGCLGNWMNGLNGGNCSSRACYSIIVGYSECADQSAWLSWKLDESPQWRHPPTSGANECAITRIIVFSIYCIVFFT